ncbi:MAG: hypothetical protein KGZ79_10950 [Dethiobacter sp.]|jgi:hypothetical protein|nr:hypothetical protein [Dethiobacter sp.]
MEIKKKLPPPIPSLPRHITRYRNINESSAYIPYIYRQSAFDCRKNLIIVDEQEDTSADE